MYKQFINFPLRRAFVGCLSMIFLFTSLTLPVSAQAVLHPAPLPSPIFYPPVIKGITVNPNNPFEINFLVDQGSGALFESELRSESGKLIKYFLTALTIPEEDLWVNLSPLEKNRIITAELGQTDMGREMLAQDYELKLLTARLVGDLISGKNEEESKKRKTTSSFSPLLASNFLAKIWVTPNTADVFERDNTAYIIKGDLKVRMEEDYLA